MQELVDLPVGEALPDFALPDVLSGSTASLRDFAGKIVVLKFWSVECPWCSHHDAYLVEQAPLWAREGIRLVLINSNANETPEQMRAKASEIGLRCVPILHDEGNVVADQYGALTTPHLFIAGPDGRLLYRGAMDDRTFRQRTASVNYLERVLDALKSGQPAPYEAVPPYGCTIVRQIQ
ncbi:MAG: redoxin domain-containing protein [Anaerolineae bacterium]|nr:redoxin domain-containing protein [Anaerolineae bacterium]